MYFPKNGLKRCLTVNIIPHRSRNNKNCAYTGGVIKCHVLQIIREFIIGDKPYIVDAPEQCELKGWLFRRGEII